MTEDMRALVLLYCQLMLRSLIFTVSEVFGVRLFSVSDIVVDEPWVNRRAILGFAQSSSGLGCCVSADSLSQTSHVVEPV
jgi:hypothetical protein